MPNTREDHLLPEGWIDIVGAVGFDESHANWTALHAAVERAARAATAAELERIANTWGSPIPSPSSYVARSLRERAEELFRG